MYVLLLSLVGLLLLTQVLGCAAVGGQASYDPPTVTYGTTKRYAMSINVRPEKLAYYKQLHADPWPSVLQALVRANIHNYSIHLIEIRPGEHTLFGYFEYTGDNFDADMAELADNPEVQRWWAETGPCQSAIPITQSKQGENPEWAMMEEVFYTA